MLPQACVERDDGGRRDLLEPSINGAEAWAGGRATRDEHEKRQKKNKATDTCGLVATDLELPSLRLIRFLKMLETSLGHCFGRLRLS